ncbi:MAG TPA: hypothetical protein VGE41_02610, partial [Verrucomicrobiae bacterium]
NPKLETKPIQEVWPAQHGDLTFLILLAASFYVSVLGSMIFWWRFRSLRRKEKIVSPVSEDMVPEKVSQYAEVRWSKRVLGVTCPALAEKTRYSNAPVEQNFLMQLRVIYKLVVEWRRQENQWAEDDSRLTESGSDEWLNGLDEFVAVIGLYMRFIIKAGAKDGFHKESFWEQNEDSNHLWSRLVMYFSEYYWALLTLSRHYQNQVLPELKADASMEIARLLSNMGVRQRTESFDAGHKFNFPGNPRAMDLLLIQKPGVSLRGVMETASEKLGVPFEHIERILSRFHEFKKREQPYPIHPYIIELAKLLPHFFLMGLGALVWYNQRSGDSPIAPYLWSLVTHFALSLSSLVWALPLVSGIVLEVLANFVRVYRFEAPMLARSRAKLFLDATVTSLFTKSHAVLPNIRRGYFWNPNIYRQASWILRGGGLLLLGISLLQLDTPSFATFLIVKGILAVLAFVEVGAIVVPILATLVSKGLQDFVSDRKIQSKLLIFLNRLNITATRPASPLWLSFKYHTQPSMPTGTLWGTGQAIAFYFLLSASFLVVGGYLTEQILSLWFTDTYLNAANWKLFLGGLMFWNTMYLLRYGIFLLYVAAASFISTWPLKAAVTLAASAYILLEYLQPSWNAQAFSSLTVQGFFLGAGLLAIVFEKQILDWMKKAAPRWFKGSGDYDAVVTQSETQPTKSLLNIALARENRTLGIVYMSGDDLSAAKLNPDLLLSRWKVLRDQLASKGTRLLFKTAAQADDATVHQWFAELFRTEAEAGVTLWHPVQLVIAGEPCSLDSSLALNITVPDAEAKEQLLLAWHLRRWLVSMMSTAGHSQDTAINLVDIAVRLAREGIAKHSAFYLVQNKYDTNDNNRPSQTPYTSGELAQRNKLARLLCALAPGARAYSLQNWTPFGFKAGGLTGMDLVPEESMQLSSMLLLDRNATVHDLDALMVDLKRALWDPSIVIIIPGRGTTNTLTSLGQASQMVEEGHRSFLKGLMGLLGGSASEAVGTGWGNLLAVFYGRVQRAMLNAQTLKMPLTSRMYRGSNFQMRCEGLIGFTPHAVGISEDTWAVSQAAHNGIALGHRVKFLVSNAIWHKIRETWSHAEWLASFPRWSGGYLQMMHDPLMQRINDFGPGTVFAREIRANSGRNFLSAPFALVNILLMPLAIMLDLTPFVQILIILWNFGFLMNQILTAHALNTFLETSGFHRLPAFLCGLGASIAAYTHEATRPMAPALALIGFVFGGFFAGLSRWLYTRLRDLLLFGPQLVLHALGQIVRQTLEFQVSGASPEDARGVNMAFRSTIGPREDRPLDGFATFINMRTIIWGFGFTSFLLNLVALANLDMLNVLLLLPSLLFSVSVMAGPFLLKPKIGKPIGLWSLLPKGLAWASVIVFYTTLSILLIGGPRRKFLGMAILIIA